MWNAGLSPCALWVNKRLEVSLVCQCGPWPSAPEDMLLRLQHLRVYSSWLLTNWGDSSSVATPTTTHKSFLSRNVQHLVAIKQHTKMLKAPISKPLMLKTCHWHAAQKCYSANKCFPSHPDSHVTHHLNNNFALLYPGKHKGKHPSIL